jgi:hypothetical protein
VHDRRPDNFFRSKKQTRESFKSSLILKFNVAAGTEWQDPYLLPASKRLWSMIDCPFKLGHEDSNEKSHAAGSSRKSQRQISGKRPEASAGHDA